jgi:hypothetical protein
MTLPHWINPQLTKLVEKTPTGPQWVHEVKFDGYRMAARVDQGNVRIRPAVPPEGLRNFVGPRKERTVFPSCRSSCDRCH